MLSWSTLIDTVYRYSVAVHLLIHGRYIQIRYTHVCANTQLRFTNAVTIHSVMVHINKHSTHIQSRYKFIAYIVNIHRYGTCTLSGYVHTVLVNTYIYGTYKHVDAVM